MEKMGLIGPKPDLRKDPSLEASGFERFKLTNLEIGKHNNYWFVFLVSFNFRSNFYHIQKEI